MVLKRKISVFFLVIYKDNDLMKEARKTGTKKEKANKLIKIKAICNLKKGIKKGKKTWRKSNF